jgi:hypothetical protein
MDRESECVNTYKTASHSHLSAEMKYTLVDISMLLELVVLVRNNCKVCVGHGILRVHSVDFKGSCLEIKLACEECGAQISWKSSLQYPDTSFQVNRDIARSLTTSGGERSDLFRFFDSLRCGMYCSSSFDATVDIVETVIFEEEDRQYQLNIRTANQEFQTNIQNATVVGFNCQHSRSQRSFGPAPFATATFINHTPGPGYKQILFQSHMSTNLMKADGLVGLESKDKIVTHNGLKIMELHLNKIQKGICDMSSSGNKSWTEVIAKSNKHHGAICANCAWHKTKSIAKSFKTKLLEHKTKLKTKVGNREYIRTYPELGELGITAKKIQNHWIWCQKQFPGNPAAMGEAFMDVVEFYDMLSDHTLTQDTKDAFESWVEKEATHLERYCDGLLTDLEESFHNLNKKYWRKGVQYSFRNYMARRALAALDWCEQTHFRSNSPINTYSNKYLFEKRIAQAFDDFMWTRSPNKATSYPRVSYGIIYDH